MKVAPDDFIKLITITDLHQRKHIHHYARTYFVYTT